ncbi:hypothetical protein GN958_ATG03522 [Phytophthora infestans]|uniref:Uncharacterized protein n=1 Tax=Phytophthora infestans TaxID=4787 RepID=A0A8S9V9T9_PHYIN|nr:hypothetical protein GN958_ATG03522 [Phytophthora infestans]
MRGSTKARQYALARIDVTNTERQTRDEKFLRSQAGKEARKSFWQTPRDGVSSDSDDEDPKDTFELIQMSLHDTEIQLCGAPHSLLLKRMYNEYARRMREAEELRKRQRARRKQLSKADALKKSLKAQP